MIVQATVALPEPFDLSSAEIEADPFPSYAILRKQHPCYWSPKGQLWILSRLAAAAQDWQTFSSLGDNLIDEIPRRAGALIQGIWSAAPPKTESTATVCQSARFLLMVCSYRKTLGGLLVDSASELLPLSVGFYRCISVFSLCNCNAYLTGRQDLRLRG